MQTERSIKIYSRKFGKGAGKDKREEKQGDYYAGRDFDIRPNLLMSCYNAWQSLASWRDDIRRNEEFVYGDQWSDKVWDAKRGRYITERQMLIEQGLQPSQYNIIRNVLRTIGGFWASNKTLPSVIAQKDENQEESEILTATLHALYRKNELWKFDMSELNKMLISGLATSKNIYTNRNGKSDVVNDFVDPFAFFVDNSMKDPRYEDCSLVGCFYDMPIDDIAGMLCKGSRERAKKIRRLFSEQSQERVMQMVETFTDKRIEKDFFNPDIEGQGLGRIIEVWRKESAECFWVHDYRSGEYYPDFKSTEAELKAENALRRREQGEMGVAEEDMLLLDYKYGDDQFWKYYYMTSFGDVIDEGVNPFWHGLPPILFEMHEFYVGKIYPFVKDLLDANKQINKLSAISELLTRYSAKSLVFFPIGAMADERGYGMDYIEQKMTDYDAVIPFNAEIGAPEPKFVNTVAQAFTPLNVVNMYLKLSEQVSGVFGALQGQQPTAGTPAQSFLQQSQNSATSLVGVFEAINSFRVRRDKMNVQLMQQFYTGKRWIFDKESGKHLMYDPERVKNIDVEISIVENTNTPAYRLMVNDILMQLKEFDVNNMIDLRGLIEVGNWPFKDKLLDYLNGREQEMQEAAAAGQMPQGGGQLPPELAQEMGQYGFAPDVVEQFGNLPESVQNFQNVN